jgi:two-component system, OmpR family, sensor histidine kinase KdpD
MRPTVPIAGAVNIKLRPYLGGLALALGALAIAIPINALIDVPALARVFLVGILISAINFGLWPSIFASLISAVLYDVFFLPPVYSLSIASRQDVIDLVCFLFAAIITSALAARVRRYAIAADERAISAEKIADFCRRLGAALSLESAANESAALLSEHLRAPVSVMLPRPDTRDIIASFPPNTVLSARALGAVNWKPDVAEQQHLVIDGAQIMYLSASSGRVGLVMVRLLNDAGSLTDKQRQSLDPLLFHIALVVERFSLQQRLLDVRLQKEAEKLRATVLTSLSHDLRAPLASIVAGASGLCLHWQHIDDPAKIGVIRTVQSEAERLDGFIDKIIDITRVEHGAVTPRMEPTVLGRVVCSAFDQLEPVLANYTVNLEFSDDLPLVDTDPVLLLQVVVNILDNAAKYSPEGSMIRVRSEHDGTIVRLDIIDEGCGIPQDDLPRLFDRFYRGRSTVDQVPGTGLGLAICHGFLQAMNSTIRATNRSDAAGMMFAISLPLAMPELKKGEPIE